jgi:hypothetical protein
MEKKYGRRGRKRESTGGDFVTSKHERSKGAMNMSHPQTTPRKIRIPVHSALSTGLQHHTSTANSDSIERPASTPDAELAHLPPASRELLSSRNRASMTARSREYRARLCTICRHADRDAIEQDFIHRHALSTSEYIYDIKRRALYRHAHAFNLFARRHRNIRTALGHIIQRAQLVDPTADTIVRAIHFFTRIQ